MIHNRGLDLPMRTQFARHLGNLARLEFGTSWQTGRDLRDVFLTGAKPSLLITVPGFFAAFAASVALALFQVFVRNSPLDRSLTLLSVALMSLPTMVYVIFGQAGLALGLSYFPAYGFSYGTFGTVRFLLLPVTIFILINLGYDARLYRAIFLEEIGQDYIRTAHAKGLSNTRVLSVHVFKNGLIAIITLVVAQLPKLVLGSLLIESPSASPASAACSCRRSRRAISRSSWPAFSSARSSTSAASSSPTFATRSPIRASGFPERP